MFSAITSDVSIRNNTSVLFGNKTISVGPFFQYEMAHSYAKDQAFGVSLRTGEKFIYELGAGSYQKTFENINGTGSLIFFLFGAKLNSILQVSILTINKEIAGGDLEKRSLFDIYPSLGIDWAF